MLRPVALPKELTRGKLYLCSMPGRYEALEVFLQEIAEAEVDHVVCLVSDEEIALKSPDYLEARQRNQLPAKLWRYDIPDYGLPENADTLIQTLDQIRSLLDNGESVVIHCAAGCGRTGLASTLLLKRMGLPLDQAIKIIRHAGSAPDTQDQRDFLEQHALPSIPISKGRCPESRPEETELPPLYFVVLPMLTPEQSSGADREATQRRGFALAMTRDESTELKCRFFHQDDWAELVALIESRPLVIGYDCLDKDLEYLRSRGEVRPQKVCDLMRVYEKRRRKRVDFQTATERTIGFHSMLSVKEAAEWFSKGGEKQVIFHLKQHLSAMARMHEFMIEKGWNMETPKS